MSMDVNLNDWLGDHTAMLWLLVGFMLLTLEVLRRDLVLMLLSLGAAVAMVVALVAPRAWYVQLPVGVLAAVASVLLLRPVLLRAEERAAARAAQAAASPDPADEGSAAPGPQA